MTNSNIKVGDTVTFRDEFDNKHTGTVTRLIPKGEEAKAPSVAIKGTYGFYVRAIANVELAQSDKPQQ